MSCLCILMFLIQVRERQDTNQETKMGGVEPIFFQSNYVLQIKLKQKCGNVTGCNYIIKPHFVSGLYCLPLAHLQNWWTVKRIYNFHNKT